MKKILPVLALVSLSACVVHLHIHEAPKPEPVAAISAPAEVRSEVGVSGIVTDEQGHPIRAHVALVGPSGSFAMGTGKDGRFSLTESHWPEFVVNATTTDDLVAIEPRVRAGTRDLTLVVRPAAAATIRLDGMEKTRCALFHDGVRVEDFTLKAGAPARVVLPAGDIRVEIYDGKTIHAQRDVHLEVGDHKDVVIGAG